MKRSRQEGAPTRLREGQLVVQVTGAGAGMTPEQLEAWADRYIGYILESEGLDSLPADSDHEAA